MPRWNFTDFMHSFMIVFRVLCGEWIGKRTQLHKRPIDLSFRDCWAKQLFPDGFEFVAISPKESTEKHTKGVLLFSQGFGSSVLLCSNSYNIIIYDIMTQVRPRVGTGEPSAGPG